MENKEPQELEEFTLEDIIKEFSDHPETVDPVQEEVAEEAAEETAEETADEQVEEEPAAEVAVEEPTIAFVVETEETAEETASEEDVEEPTIRFEAEPAEAVEEPTIRFEAEPAEVPEETAEETPVTSDTVRLDRAEILKGVVRNAQPIEEEEETEELQMPQQEEKPAFTKDWRPAAAFIG